MATSTKKHKGELPANGEKPVRHFSLEELHFDPRNPRYGNAAGGFKNETEMLDYIVEKFGVDDVLSSLAVNGFFESEPLVGTPGRDGIKVLEGNRLILVGDSRAKNQKGRTQKYQELHKKYDEKPVSPVPVIVYEGAQALKELLPYLGVRHIVGATEWDSYAKAAWVARVVEDGELSLEDIVQMIGDSSRTAPRILGGFYLVEQLSEAGRFNPADSFRKGRGSNPDYPFSWVYNALDYAPICRWIGFPEDFRKLGRKPAKNLENAEWLMMFLFGNRSKNFQPSISDSREIGDLAKTVADKEQLHALKKGKPVSEALKYAQPAFDLLSDELRDIRDKLDDAIGVVNQGTLRAAEAEELLETSRKVRALASNLHEDLIRAASPHAGDK